MDFTKMFMGGAVIGTLISCWGFIKSFGWQILSIVVKRESINQDLAISIGKYLIKYYSYSNFRQRQFRSHFYKIKNIDKDRKTVYEDLSNFNILFWKDIIPLFIYKVIIKQEEKNNIQLFYIYYLRGSLDFIKLIKDSTSYHNNLREKVSETKERFFIKKYDNLSDLSININISYDFNESMVTFITEDEDNIGFASKIKMSNLVLTKELEETVKIAELWKKNREWFFNKNITWKTGWLLWGEPGTGKTALARAIAKKLDLPIYIFRLAGTTSKKFEEQWLSMRNNSPCIALIEDFDNIFHGRNNITKRFGRLMVSNIEKKDDQKDKNSSNDKDENNFSDELTFDTFLNMLDGVEQYDGIFTIITTNNLEYVDPAILNRPGRIDKVLNLTYLTHENKFKLIDKILFDMPIAKEKMINYINENYYEQMTPAQLQEKCTSLALMNLYGENCGK